MSQSLASSRLHEQLLGAVEQAVMATELDGTIIYWNRAAEMLYGWCSDEVLGRSIIDVTPAAASVEQAGAIMERLRAGESWRGEFVVRRKDGSTFLAQVVDSPIVDDDGRLVGIVGVSYDISEQKAREQTIEESNVALRRSEVRLRSFVNATSQAVWTADEQGNVDGVSATWSDYTGQSLDEYRGWGWVSVIHPDDRERVVETWKRHLAAKTDFEIEFRARSRSGTYRWFNARKVPVFDKEGRLIEWIGVCADIEARKKAEAALRASESRYRTIVNTANEGVWVIDENGCTTFANERLCTMLGYALDELNGRPFFDFVAAEDRAVAEARFELRKRGASETYDIRFRRQDGRLIWVLIAGCPVYNEDGSFAGSMGMLTDITERKHYEQGLVEAKERAEDLARLKTALLTNMSHEIRTPLTGILGFAEIIGVEASPDVAQYAQYIVHSGERLMATLNSVLELAQLESRSMELLPERIDVVEQVRDLLPMFEHQAGRSNLYVRLEFDQSHIFAEVDRGALLRVVTNLVSNGLKFTQLGGVTVRLGSRDGLARIDVIDTGIGMDKTFLTKLFDDFKQESEGLARSYEGAGLGLSVTQRLVHLMGGTIEVESAKGAGSRFTVCFPLAQQAEMAA